MTVVRIPPDTESPASGRNSIVDAGRVRMRARLRHQATVLTISGDIDVSNSDRVQSFADRFILVGNALAFDLSGVDFFAVQGISVLIAVDDACRAAQVPWAVIPSRTVRRVLQLTGCDTTVPTANSVAEALRQATGLSQTRRPVAAVT